VKGKFLTAFILILAISTFSLPLLAHHGNAVYDDTKTITLKGTVTQWVWANPHCILHLDVTDDGGQVVSWIVETENPTSMFNIGWSKTSFNPGDQVTVTALQVKNGKPIGRIVDALLPSGQKLVGKARLNTNESSK
jgi:Family of unknown function (DUF6152)